MEKLINKKLRAEAHMPLSRREQIILKTLMKNITKYIDCKE